MGFLTFLKKSKPASSPSPNDAELSIPPPPPFPQTAEPLRDAPPPAPQESAEEDLSSPGSFSSDLPDFKPFNQDVDSPPLGLPEFEDEKPEEEPHDSMFMPRPSMMPPPPMATPEKDSSMDEIEEMPQEEPEHHLLEPEPMPELPPLKQPPRPVRKQFEQVIRHPNGLVFMQAERIAYIGDELLNASDHLRKIGVRVQQVEEQERAMEEWKSQLELLYRKLAAAEKSIFAGD